LCGVKTKKWENLHVVKWRIEAIWVSCLQRQRGTINSLCCLPQVIVYYGLVQMNLFHICNKLKYLLAMADFAFQVLLAKLHLCQQWPSRLAWLQVNKLLKAVWNSCLTTAYTAFLLCVCVCVCVCVCEWVCERVSVCVSECAWVWERKR